MRKTEQIGVKGHVIDSNVYENEHGRGIQWPRYKV